MITETRFRVLFSAEWWFAFHEKLCMLIGIEKLARAQVYATKSSRCGGNVVVVLFSGLSHQYLEAWGLQLESLPMGSYHGKRHVVMACPVNMAWHGKWVRAQCCPIDHPPLCHRGGLSSGMLHLNNCNVCENLLWKIVLSLKPSQLKNVFKRS